MTIELNDTGVKVLHKNDALIYIGDSEFFAKKTKVYSDVIKWDPFCEPISKAISHCVEGVVIEKGSKAFKGFEIEAKIGDKVMFQGHFGSIFSRKKPTENQPDNRAYYRIITDKDFNGFCTQKKEEFESFI